ncbi:hypothetical protein F443_01461 [Phytophthora nicotianae P1569]|uniref:Tc1-like transposase DDE domain-containing protein n=1 Tax=Phytophthora nicotianae P1569 TaxID=1317065 RepID=V9FWS0_PHYNI|nr:hypothetical protein F443_01461 [Phytophthora nicotianae P1569]
MSKWKQVLGDSVHVVIRVLLPFAHLNYGTGFIYQQDNASIHASKRTKESSRSKTSTSGLAI